MDNSIAAVPNILLAALPRKEYLKLLPDLSPVTLVEGDLLYEPNAPLTSVYFPQGCLVSLLTKVDRRLELEIGMVGREGMVGTPLALGIKVSAVRALVQGGGPALRMSRARFLSVLQRSPPFRHAIYRYIDVLIRQIGRTAACNHFHVVEKRLARWLLMTRDRVAASEFRMTQEFLSHMLGVRREGVTEAASSFQRDNLIEYSRGHIKILDHRGLEAASCSCYTAGSEAIAPWRPACRQIRPRQLAAGGAVLASAPIRTAPYSLLAPIASAR